jgi:prefoldin subunit 5
MAPENENRSVVEYPIRDILEEIKKSIQSIDDKLDNKANLVDVQSIRKDLDEVKKAVTELQTARSIMEGWKRWGAPLIVAGAMLVVSVLALYHPGK